MICCIMIDGTYNDSYEFINLSMKIAMVIGIDKSGSNLDCKLPGNYPALPGNS